MPGHAVSRWWLPLTAPASWLAAVLASVLATTPTLASGDTETVQLRGYALQAWADARLQPRRTEPIPLRLALLRNDSVTSSEEPDPAADRDDAERGGVPVAVLDALLAGQLQGSGRFAVIDDDVERARDGGQLTVRILRYEPPYRHGERSGFWQQTRSYWRSWVAEEPQPLAVTVEAIWHDAAHGQQRRLTVQVDGDSCLRLQQAPTTAVTPAPTAFSSEYRYSSIGQASLAAVNRIVAWLEAMHGYEQQSLAVVAVRGNRLQLADPGRWLQGRQELTLYHRDHDDYAIGQIRLAAGDGELREAWPLTLAAGSVRPGDWVRISRPTPAPSILPASQPPGSHCRNEDEEPQTAAAATSDNRHTDAPLPPAPEEDRPGS
ncbi:MAG TPA: hypothetical protein VFV64_13530 [Permianibacter sp.]|nr:hypothetical protein [Permianibacter sp.]